MNVCVWMFFWGGMLLMAPGSASLVQQSVNYPFSLLHKVHPLTHQPMSFKLDDWQPWAASGGEAGSVGEVIKCYQSRFVYDDWKALFVCKPAEIHNHLHCPSLHLFYFLLYFFPVLPFSFSLWLRRVLCARRTFSSPLWWYWLQSLPWLQPWSIDQPALLEANKHTCDAHKVCVWVITRCQAPRPNAPQGECKSPELLLSCAHWVQWQAVDMGFWCFSYYPS